MSQHLLRRLSKLDASLWAAIVVTLFIGGCALAAPWLSPVDPTYQTLSSRLLPPGADGYLLGTDHLGRDMLARLLYGSRISILVGLAAVVVAGTIGTTLGLLGGYLGGGLDRAITWLANVQLAFPIMLLAVALAAVLGGGIDRVIGVLAVTSWVGYARVVRAQVLTLREQEFVHAAVSMGASVSRIMRRHLLPNLLGPLMALASLELARMVILEAALGFLGLGVPPSVPSLGSMIAEGRPYLEQAWWISSLPGALLTISVLAVNVVGDGLHDHLAGRKRR